MNGLCRPIAAPLPVTLQGRTYLLRPLVLQDIGTIEQHILANRESPLRTARQNIEGLQFELAKHVLDRGFDEELKLPNYVSSEQFENFLDSRPGIKFSLWLMLRRDQQDITLEYASAIVDALTEAELQQLREWRDQVSGCDLLGEGTGPVLA